MKFSFDKLCVTFLMFICMVDCQICLDKYRRFPNHTMCLSWSRIPQDKAIENEILGKHNDIRANVVPAAANMLQMKYFKSLRIEAQIWAEQCSFSHDDFHLRFQPARYDVGQNILTSPVNLSWTRVIDQWLKEKTVFIYGSSSNTPSDISNYTQIVNAETRAVGCGSAYCNGTYFYVCNYSPRLSPADISMPYVRSRSNSSCDSCPLHCNTNGTSTLCSCEGKFCLNGGYLNLATCGCDCVKDVKSYNASAYCELLCEPNGDHPDCSHHKDSECLSNSTIDFMCPWKCGICPWGGSTYKRGSVPMPWECPKPGNIKNGSVSYSGLNEGDVATYKCQNDLIMLYGNETRACQNKQWTGDEPKCHSLEDIKGMIDTACKGILSGSTSCPDPNPALDGQVVVKSFVSVKLAIYTCNSGYYIASGDSVRVCENGRWNGTTPICTAKLSLSPTNFTNNSRPDAFTKGCQHNDAANSVASMITYIALVFVFLCS